MYLYTADKETGIVSGFIVEYNSQVSSSSWHWASTKLLICILFLLQKLTAKPIWKLNLGGTGNTQKITNIATKNPIEHVHSQGRVFNDRSVLYKYINPNLVAIATQGPDNIHKCNR